MKAAVKATVILLLVSCTSLSVSAQFNKRSSRDFINKTSYIIGEAYDMVYYYGYYSSGDLSRAVNHQNYAKYLYNVRNYRYAVYHSDLARTYALRVIYFSNNYWDNYYRPYYYSPNYPNYGYNNRPPQDNRNVTYAPRKSATGASSTRTSTPVNTRISKYSASSGNDLTTVEFNDWNRNYYSNDERSLLRSSSVPSERDLESAVAANNNIRRVSNDNEVINNGIRDFSSDIDTYKKTRTEEARTISISRPSDMGTTPEVTRSTANTSSTRQPETRPTDTRPAQTQPTETRPADTRPAQNQPAETRPTDTRPAQNQPTGTRPTETRPVQNQPTETRPTETRPVQNQPTETRPAETRPTQSQPTETRPTQSQPAGTRPTDTKPTQNQPTETRPATRPTDTRPVQQNQSTETRSTDTRPAQNQSTQTRSTETRPAQNQSTQTRSTQTNTTTTERQSPSNTQTNQRETTPQNNTRTTR